LLISQLCADDVAFAPGEQPAFGTFFTPPLQEIKFVKRIIFVEDAAGKKFILKYPRSPNHALNDALGAKIGEFIGVNINHVKIFPPQDPSLSSVDKFPHQIKTLHTLVPGNEVRQLPNIQVTIKSGLKNKSKLRNITKHKDLYKIVALDIFLNNADRHNGNLFYDLDNDHFYAIDMDAIYYRQHLLATIAYEFIEGLHRKKLSLKEKNILRNIYKILQKLISYYPPEELCNLRKSLAEQAHHQYTESEQEHFKNLVEHNFHEVERLQRLLNRFLAKAI
jgi:hypothetical protein